MNSALGMVETRGLATAVAVADIMVKTADVKLLGVERAKGSGWVTVKVSGDVGGVKASVEAGIAMAETCNDYVASKVIPRPVDAVRDMFMQDGQACDWADDYENGTLRSTEEKKVKKTKKAPAKTESSADVAEPDKAKAPKPVKAKAPEKPAEKKAPTENKAKEEQKANSSKK